MRQSIFCVQTRLSCLERQISKSTGRLSASFVAAPIFLSAGHHTIEIKDSFLDGGWQSKVEWAPGQTYFIEIGPVQTYGIAYRALTAALSNTRGRQMAGSGLLAKFSFFALDAAQGRAEIAKIKSARR
jgi:hypothetical protein